MPTSWICPVFLCMLAVINKHFLGASCVPGLGLNIEDTEVGSGDEVPFSQSFCGGGLSGGCRSRLGRHL